MATPTRRTTRPPRQRASKMSRDARVAEILAVARERFCDQGFAAVSVADIAQRVGISEATVFKYFPTKRELLGQVIEHWYGDLFGDYSRELEVIEGARNRFRYLAWRHLCTLREDPAMCRLIFTEVRSQPDYARSPTHRMNLRYTGLLMDVIREGAKSGEFRTDLPLELMRDLVYGGIEHHAWRFLYGSGRLDVEKITEQLVDLLCNGIFAAPPARPDDRLPELVERLERAARALAPEKARPMERD